MSEANRTNNTNTSGTHTEDPLAELARIVSGDTAIDATQSLPDSLTNTANDDFALDLESELLRELDGSQAEVKPDTSESELALALGVHLAPQAVPISETQSFEDQLLSELDLGQDASTIKQETEHGSEISPTSPIEKQMQADLQAAEAAVAIESPSPSAVDSPDSPEAAQVIDVEQIVESPTEQLVEQVVESTISDIFAASEINPQLSSDESVELPMQASPTSEVTDNELDDIFAQGFADELSAENTRQDTLHDVQAKTPQVEDLGEVFAKSISQIEQNAHLNVQDVDTGYALEMNTQPSFEALPEANVESRSQVPFDVPVKKPQYDANQLFDSALTQEPVSQEFQQYNEPIQPDLGAAIPQYESEVDHAKNQAQIQMDSAMDAAFADPGSLGSEDMAHSAENTSSVERRGGGLKLALGALGVALFAGLGIVAWGAMNSDSVTNDAIVPIISAEQSPTKVKPQDPGGKKIENTDNKVYENVTGNGVIETTQEKLINSRQALKPLDTNSLEQKNISRLQPGANNVSRNSLGGVSPKKVKTFTIKSDGSIVRATVVKNQLAVSKPEAPAAVVQQRVSSLSRPIATPVVKPSIEIAAKRPTVIPVVKSSTPKIATQRPTASAPTRITNSRPANNSAKRPTPVVTQIPTPKLNPNGPTNIAALPRNNAPTNVATSSAKIPAGTYTVQVSSQRSDAAAKASFQNIKKRFSSVIGNRNAVIQKASVQGKGTFFRAKIPMASKAEATNLCASLKRAGGSCFVSR